MRVTPKVKEILSWYEGESPGVKANLARLLMEGRLSGSGKLVILPVDQGYEHGPARSFAPTPAAYDPHYLFDLALEAGLSAYAAPLAEMAEAAGGRLRAVHDGAVIRLEPREDPRSRLLPAAGREPA